MKISFNFQSLCVLYFLSMAPFLHAKFNNYQIDQAHSTVSFEVANLKFRTVTGQFKEWQASFDFDAASGKVANLMARFDLDSIDTANKDRDDHLRGPDFFHVRDKLYDLVPARRYMTFKGTKYFYDKRKRLQKVEGTLNLKGKSKKVVLMVSSVQSFSAGGRHNITFNAKTSINRKDFGITWDQKQEAKDAGFWEKVKGKVKNATTKTLLKLVGDEVAITINASAMSSKTK